MAQDRATRVSNQSRPHFRTIVRATRTSRRNSALHQVALPKVTIKGRQTGLANVLPSLSPPKEFTTLCKAFRAFYTTFTGRGLHANKSAARWSRMTATSLVESFCVSSPSGSGAPEGDDVA